MELRDGTTVSDPRLDRIYEEDWNSLNYPVTSVLNTIAPYETFDIESFSWKITEVLNQGLEGACVGFAFTHEALCRPNVVRSWNGQVLDDAFAREHVYWPAQELDEFPGGSYPGANPQMEGSSILAGAKAMVMAGLYTSYFWALDVKQLALAVSYLGPAVLGINVYEGMYNTNPNGFIKITGRLVGGHAILCNGFKLVRRDSNGPKTWENTDIHRSYFTLHNSWGATWGVNGECKITVADMQRLFTENIDACIPVRAS